MHVQLSGRDREAAAGPITVGVLSVVTLLALVLKDVGFVVSISGAMFGCLLMFIVPAIMTISNIKVRLLRLLLSYPSERYV